VQGWETDPNAYLYFIAPGAGLEGYLQGIAKEGWITDPNYATPDARLPRLKRCLPRWKHGRLRSQVRSHGTAQRA